MASKNSKDQVKTVDILSFDGGGSRGIMEVAILSDVMRLATIIWKNPEKLDFLQSNNIFKDQNLRQRLICVLNEVSKPIHPNDIYDMIIGTSTGALIAFGLVGGNCDEDGKRLPMTLDECIQMYKNKTGEIFTMSLLHLLESKLPGLGSVPLIPYSKAKVEQVLREQFDDCTLSDFKNTTPIVGALARQIGPNDGLELFDTRSQKYEDYKIYQVLNASTDAPIYFDAPVKIGVEEFVDGGVGGNCPLPQGIHRVREIFGADVVLNTALSIAPPSSKELHIPRHFQIKYWLRYFVEMSTNGYPLYLDSKKRNKSVTLRRLSPRGQSLKKFKLDEKDAQKMLNALNSEKTKDGLFLVDIIAIATFVVDTYLRKSEEHHKMTVETAAKLCQKAAEIYRAKEECDLALEAYYVSESLWEKFSGEDKKDAAILIKEGIADCLTTQGKYNPANIYYQECVHYWSEHSKHAEKVTASLKLAECYFLMYRHKEAENQLREVLEIQKEIYQKMPNKEIAYTLTRLGWCNREQGKYEKAVEHCTTALSIEHQLYTSGRHLVIAETLSTLALTYSEQGKHEDAAIKARGALDIRKKLIEQKNDPLIAESLSNLGSCLVLKGDTKEGLKYLDEALKMKKELFGDTDHCSIAITLKNIAKALLTGTKKQSNSAFEFAQEALGMMKACLGDVVNTAIADIHWVVGLCFENNDNHEKAIAHFRTCLRMRQLILGSEHPKEVDLLHDLGRALMNQGKKEEAEVYFERAMKLEESTNTRDHILASLANTLAQCDKHLSVE